MRHNCIVWNFYGKDIADHARIRESLANVARNGFGAVEAQLRDYSFQIDQPEVVAAVVEARDTAHRLGLRFLLRPDLWRAVPGFLTRHPHARQHLVVPIEAALEGGDIRLTLPHSDIGRDAHQHLAYDFAAVERVFTYRLERRLGMAEDIAGALFPPTVFLGSIDHRCEMEMVVTGTVTDITASTTAAADAARRVVAISGHWRPPDAGEWRVMAFVRLAATTFDYAAPEAVAAQLALLDLYHRALGGRLDGVQTDEPGHPPRSSNLDPRNGFFVSQEFYRRFAAARGYDLRDRLHALVRETDDGGAGRVRCDYYTELGATIHAFQQAYKRHALARFGPGLAVGAHATAGDWSAIDLQRGSHDYWKMAESTTEGYTDGKHHDRYNALFSIVLAKSLAKLTDSGTGFAQTWDMLPSAANERYWSNVVATYGLRWRVLDMNLFAYDFPAAGLGARYDERWRGLATVNAKMDRLDEITHGAPAEANVLTIFPLETVMRIGTADANPLRRTCHLLAYYLQAAHYQTDIVSADVLARARVERGGLVLDGRRYDAVVYPFPGSMPRATYERIVEYYEGGGKLLVFGCPPSETTAGEDLGAPFAELLGIRPVTRMYDYVDIDPTTPYSGIVAFAHELSSVPTVNISEGLFAHIPWCHYLWPIVPAAGSPVALNVRWKPGVVWVGAERRSAAGGRLLYLGFDLTSLVDPDQLLGHLLRELGVTQLVAAPPGVWTGLVRRDDSRSVVLCCRKDGAGPVAGRLRALGHTIEVDGVEDVLAVTFLPDGGIGEIVAAGARRLVIDGVERQPAR